MSISTSDIQAIIAALQESDWDQASVVIGDVTINVGRRGMTNGVAAHVGVTSEAATPPAAAALPVVAPPVEAAAAPSPPTVAVQPAAAGGTPTAAPGDVIVAAPTIGVFYSAPKPGAPPFVQVGTRVEVGDTLCIVEVMKLMTNVVASVAGTVSMVFAANASPVAHGEPLLAITPDNA